MKALKIFISVALILGIGVMGYAGYQLYETKQVYKEGNAVYEDLNNRVKKTPAAEDPQTQTTGIAAGGLPDPQETEPQEAHPQVYIPDFEIDFETLKTINKDSAAWLYSPGTVIDYPVMEASDYDYYLNHLADGTVNANGTLFIDYNNAPDFSGQVTVIYGHHMKSGSMFGGLSGYKEQTYYDEHPYMYLYTQQGNYRIDIMHGFVIAEEQWREQAFMYDENTEALLEYAKYNTTFQSGVEHEDRDRIIALSTCSYEFYNARYVVIGILTPEYIP